MATQPPRTPRETALKFLRLARDVDDAWADLDPRVIGLGPYQALTREVLSLTAFTAGAATLVLALRNMARLLDPDAVLRVDPPGGGPRPDDYPPGDPHRPTVDDDGMLNPDW